MNSSSILLLASLGKFYLDIPRLHPDFHLLNLLRYADTFPSTRTPFAFTPWCFTTSHIPSTTHLPPTLVRSGKTGQGMVELSDPPFPPLPSPPSCVPGRLGRLCECSEAELSSPDLESGCREPNGTGPLCSGKGRCQCGRCSCSGHSSGRLCECDDASCERHEGILCGGTWKVLGEGLGQGGSSKGIYALAPSRH